MQSFWNIKSWKYSCTKNVLCLGSMTFPKAAQMSYLHAAPKSSAQILPIHVSNRQLVFHQYMTKNSVHLFVLLAIESHPSFCLQHLHYLVLLSFFQANQQLLLNQRQKLLNTHLAFIKAICLVRLDICKLHNQLTLSLHHSEQNYSQTPVAEFRISNKLKSSMDCKTTLQFVEVDKKKTPFS